MKKPKIYFVSAQRGMWTDFISYQVSLDDSYYTLPLVDHNSLNKWNVGSALTHWHDGITFDLKAARTPEEARRASIRAREILSQYSDKQYVVQSHYCNDPKAIELPNVKPIRIVCDNYHKPFFFILGALKVFLDATGLAGNKPSIMFICKNLKIRDPFETIRALWLYDFANSQYVAQSYTELSLSRLFEQRSEFEKWNETFNTQAPLDSGRFEKKWADDFKLIERVFGMPYDDLLKHDWMALVFDVAYEKLAPHYAANPHLFNHFFNKALNNSAKMRFETDRILVA